MCLIETYRNFLICLGYRNTISTDHWRLAMNIILVWLLLGRAVFFIALFSIKSVWYLLINVNHPKAHIYIKFHWYNGSNVFLWLVITLMFSQKTSELSWNLRFFTYFGKLFVGHFFVHWIFKSNMHIATTSSILSWTSISLFHSRTFIKACLVIEQHLIKLSIVHTCTTLTRCYRIVLFIFICILVFKINCFLVFKVVNLHFKTFTAEIWVFLQCWSFVLNFMNLRVVKVYMHSFLFVWQFWRSLELYQLQLWTDVSESKSSLIRCRITVFT